MSRLSLRRLCCMILLLGCGCVTHVAAEEPALPAEINRFSTRLLDEGADFATTPFTLKDGNLFWTLGLAGAIGLTYVYDDDIRDHLQGGTRSSGMDKLTDIGSLVGSPYLHLGVAALVYGGGALADAPRWKQTGEMMAEALVLADGATLLIKQAVGRGRPNTASNKDEFRPFQFKGDYDSFPSMHTASSFALASVVARTSDSLPVAVLSYTAAGFVGFSRLHQNKHWASDVLLAAAIGELSGRVVTSYHADKDRRLAILPAFNGEAVTMNLLYRF